jgi:hypothetical protein
MSCVCHVMCNVVCVKCDVCMLHTHSLLLYSPQNEMFRSKVEKMTLQLVQSDTAQVVILLIRGCIYGVW